MDMSFRSLVPAQFMGPQWSEAVLLRLANATEELHPPTRPTFFDSILDQAQARPSL